MNLTQPGKSALQKILVLAHQSNPILAALETKTNRLGIAVYCASSLSELRLTAVEDGATTTTKIEHLHDRDSHLEWAAIYNFQSAYSFGALDPFSQSEQAALIWSVLAAAKCMVVPRPTEMGPNPGSDLTAVISAVNSCHWRYIGSITSDTKKHSFASSIGSRCHTIDRHWAPSVFAFLVVDGSYVPISSTAEATDWESHAQELTDSLRTAGVTFGLCYAAMRGEEPCLVAFDAWPSDELLSHIADRAADRLLGGIR
jgi:hypothetical protein